MPSGRCAARCVALLNSHRKTVLCLTFRRWDSALRNLLAAGDDHFAAALELARDKGLLRQLLQLQQGGRRCGGVFLSMSNLAGNPEASSLYCCHASFVTLHPLLQANQSGWRRCMRPMAMCWRPRACTRMRVRGDEADVLLTGALLGSALHADVCIS